MVRRPRRSATEGIHDPNLTPLIDVSLVLVVILLVATPMALQSGIAVARGASGGRAGEATRAARVEIDIQDAGHLTVNRVPVAREALAGTLGPLLADSPTREVVVRCADAVDHGTFVAVIDEAKSHGAARIAVAGR